LTWSQHAQPCCGFGVGRGGVFVASCAVFAWADKRWRVVCKRAGSAFQRLLRCGRWVSLGWVLKRAGGWQAHSGIVGIAVC
jgi:hypothetical protein